MPSVAKKPCSRPGCSNLTRERYCPDHAQLTQQKDRERGTAAQRGYDSKWRTARAGYLAKHPLCVECQRVGVIKAAMVVDHIKPHKGDKALFWDRGNWQPLCKHHHDVKTVREDGGFGR
ncbi:HNH endonuclease [Paenibacillus tyrfis]|uniref:Putative HNH nuclease YajD n=1 Tax=Paenibacillus tyrfis TaxID=1501230 RepID=A0A081NWP2_9BACL|nr:HNH endonuclease signature motif containing protein [Paenibacillus tyrfis]KEQ22865.1 HNH endonuclease [Paenibacillus tyrfis]